ncbi:DUF2243 domain-containing protein [Austwickia chelonae]|uniref:DUF2243 domain-containing protein n=1 Tax=Austwickia chelonae TaxID=100225 RepID=UPI003D314D54
MGVGVGVGVGLGGFLDGIGLHQLLQWHQPYGSRVRQPTRSGSLRGLTPRLRSSRHR